MILRAAIAASAAIALTQPLWMTKSRNHDRDQQTARAIIVDISRSMERLTATGEPGTAVARREATERASKATRVRTSETTTPGAHVASAIRWLQTQPMRRELVVISDFQTSSVSAADLEHVPSDIGRTLVPIVVSGSVEPVRPATSSEIQVLAGANEQSDVEAARVAAIASGAAATGRPDRPVSIVFPSFSDRESWIRESKPISEPWMFDAARAVIGNPVAQAAARRSGVDLSKTIRFAARSNGGVNNLAVFVDAAPHTVLATAILGAAMDAAADPIPAGEMTPTTLTPEELKGLERSPTQPDGSAPGVPGELSDGRWFWLAALVLLILEGAVRRTTVKAEVPHARVA
jgi:hypothetical protein